MPWAVGALVLCAVVVCIVIYLFIRTSSLSSRLAATNTDVASLSAALASTTTAINETRAALSNALTTEQQQIGGFQSQVGSLTGTLSSLQKLSQTDPQLLDKYSKVFFLSENYVPAHLSPIPAEDVYSSTATLQIESDVLPHLITMIGAASESNIKIYVASAYRSFGQQGALKGEYVVTYGAGTANSFSADQGYSEHQLGTAVDLTTTSLNGAIDGFDKTPAYQWMLQNAYQYGFILSYPQGNSYYEFEPWHWRFVGIKLATDLHNEGKNFYDMDQRTIDTYLGTIFD